MTCSHQKSFVLCALLSTALISFDAFALGGLGLGHSSKAKGTAGVLAINAFLCADVGCDQSNITETSSCADPNAHMDYSNRVCVCNENYKGNGTNCVSDTSCGTCPTGTYCHEGECYCTGTNKVSCGKDASGNAICFASGTLCSVNSFEGTTGTCVAKSDDAGCLTSANCPDGQYCSFEDAETTSTSSSFDKGHCVDLDAGTTENYVYSEDTMDWWSARNWCQKQGYEMVDVSTLGCPAADMRNKGFADSGCTSIPSELQGLTTAGSEQISHFWLMNTPSYIVCTDTSVAAPENVLETCEEATGATQTIEYQDDYADFFTTKIGTTELNGVHWLQRKSNFLAHALCIKN